MGRLIERPVVVDGDGTFRVESGGGRGAFIFLNRNALEHRHPGVPLAHLPDDGAVTLVLQVADLQAAQASVRAAGAIAGPGRVTVPPAAANGVMIVLQS